MHPGAIKMNDVNKMWNFYYLMLTMLQTKKLRLKFCEIPMDFSPKIKDKEHNFWNLCM